MSLDHLIPATTQALADLLQRRLLAAGVEDGSVMLGQPTEPRAGRREAALRVTLAGIEVLAGRRNLPATRDPRAVAPDGPQAALTYHITATGREIPRQRLLGHAIEALWQEPLAALDPDLLTAAGGSEAPAGNPLWIEFALATGTAPGQATPELTVRATCRG